MKKRLLTGTLVASCVGLLVYTAFYHKGVDVGVAQNHQNTHGDFKKYTPTNKATQIDAFKRLMENHAVADNTVVNTPAITTVPVESKYNQMLAVAGKVSYKEYNVASNAALRITNEETGTVLNIKPNTFVNELGELAEGNVHVSMREMHSAPQYFLSGLPMNGFESAGVIELNAVAEDGTALFIDNSKPVEVLMASAGVDENYNVYKLGESMNSWQLKNAGLKILSPALATKKKQTSNASVSLAPVKGKFHLFKKELAFKMQLNPQVFPEMQVYKDVEWVYIGKGSKSAGQKLLQDLTNPYGSRRRGNLFFNYWSDVKVFRSETGEHRMVFTNGNEKLEMAVEPRNMYGYRMNPEAMYNEYTTLMGTKGTKEVEKEVEEVDNTFNPANLPQGFTKVVRFTIDECGTWGLNRIVSYAYSLNTAITFTDENGTALNVAKLYQYDAALNTYQQIDLGSAFSMVYNTANTNVIFAVTGSNEVALLNRNAFTELVTKANAPYPLTAKLARKPINTMGDLVALFNS